MLSTVLEQMYFPPLSINHQDASVPESSLLSKPKSATCFPLISFRMRWTQGRSNALWAIWRGECTSYPHSTKSLCLPDLQHKHTFHHKCSSMKWWVLASKNDCCCLTFNRSPPTHPYYDPHSSEDKPLPVSQFVPMPGLCRAPSLEGVRRWQDLRVVETRGGKGWHASGLPPPPLRRTPEPPPPLPLMG